MLVPMLFTLSLALAALQEPRTPAPATYPTADDVPAPLDVKLGGDERKRYLLHAPPSKNTKAPASGWKLLVVMPGGDGGADFASFVGRLRQNALDDDWLVAQLVAPVWSAEQAKKLVWPTKKSPWPKMEFSCEELFAAVLADVGKERKLDPKFLFTLGWSSSGPLSYTLALADTTPITGSFIAMSVFKPDELPPLKAAKGRNFYLLHSPQDWIPIAQAQRAREELEKQGARVTFAEYEGGHGWHGDVYGTIRKGIEALAKNATAPTRKGEKHKGH